MGYDDGADMYAIRKTLARIEAKIRPSLLSTTAKVLAIVRDIAILLLITAFVATAVRFSTAVSSYEKDRSTQQVAPAGLPLGPPTDVVGDSADQLTGTRSTGRMDAWTR